MKEFHFSLHLNWLESLLGPEPEDVSELKAGIEGDHEAVAANLDQAVGAVLKPYGYTLTRLKKHTAGTSLESAAYISCRSLGQERDYTFTQGF
ncbi:MAG: hypothetical protein IJ228_10570 [Succinivibrio sp.]|nr:hypothetical protein [Succinivibrio sp.]